MSTSVFILGLMLVLASLQLQALEQLNTDPVELAVEQGGDAEFACVWQDGENATKLGVLNWHHITTNSTSIDKAVIHLTNSSKVEVRAGVLLIKNVTFADAGKYRCLDDTGAKPVEASLIVYQMPSYWTEAGILLGLSVALLLLLGLAVTLNSRFKKRVKKGAANGRR